MILTYSVTFEFETAAPITATGTVEASQVTTGARLAVKEARTLLRPRGWRSVVTVLERNVQNEAEGDEAEI